MTRQEEKKTIIATKILALRTYKKQATSFIDRDESLHNPVSLSQLQEKLDLMQQMVRDLIEFTKIEK